MCVFGDHAAEVRDCGVCTAWLHVCARHLLHQNNSVRSDFQRAATLAGAQGRAGQGMLGSFGKLRFRCKSPCWGDAFGCACLHWQDMRHFKAMLRKADNTYVKDHKLDRATLEQLRPSFEAALEGMKASLMQ